MAGFDKKYRQAIIDEYLNATGENEFSPADFLEWLRPQTGHRVWSVFYGKDDAEAAHQYRLGLARSFVSGLRITVRVTETEVVRVPAFVSPIISRSEVDEDGAPRGGRYVAVDTSEKSSMHELARQAANDLERWLGRYEGTARLLEIDTAPAKALVAALRVVSEAKKSEAA